MLLKDLEKLNLKNKEAKIYLSLLELGEANMQRICDKAKIKRTTAYGVFKSLKEKGLISTTKKNKKNFYYAENPRKIGHNIDEKKYIFNNVLPELLSLANMMGKKPVIKSFEGTEGVVEVYRDTLKFPNQELLAWVSSEVMHFPETDYLNNHYISNRVKNKIFARVIAPDDKIMREYKLKDEKSLRYTKLVSSDKFNFSVEINLYGTCSIGVMSFREEIGLIIESKQIYDTLKNIFEMNWELLK